MAKLQDSEWCRCPDLQTEYTLCRRRFALREPAEMNLAISADCRYNFYLDGKFLGRGPRRGDLEHYYYETYRETLPAGNHVLAVEVLEWRDKFNAPWSEIHWCGAFLAAGRCGDADLSTPGEWRCLADHSRRTLPWREALREKAVYPAVPMEQWSADPSLIRWKEDDFDDAAWHRPEPLCGAAVKALLRKDPPSRWKLIPDELPQMTADPIPELSVFFSDVKGEIRDGGFSAEIPAGKHIVILDLGRYYTHLPVMRGRGGSGSCRIAYGEALYNAEGRRENRGPFAGGRVGGNGYGDRIVFAECEFCFQPFWYRAGRFAELTFDLTSPLRIESLRFCFVHFPLIRKKSFHSPEDPVLEKIFEVGWHTALCCAHEHYEDCPYWEQMQYVGDTRIQALISYEAAGDGRLGRQAIRQFDWSRLGSGLTMSRYPSNFRQIIPEFSLFWVMMIADYVEYFDDPEVITEHWDGIRDVLNVFEKRTLPSGLIGNTGEWGFSDWVDGWPDGCSHRGTQEPETLVNLIYAETCRMASELAKRIGMDSGEYETRRMRVLHAVNANCRTAEGVYQDVPGRDWFSQHTNTWAILSGAAPENEQAALTEKILHDSRFSQCTLYFRFYLLELLRRRNHREGFRFMLKHWEAMLELGFTTFPECPLIQTRSDCHAWSAGPCYQLLKFQTEPFRRCRTEN